MLGIYGLKPGFKKAQMDQFYSTIINYIYNNYPTWVNKKIGDLGKTLGSLITVLDDGYELKVEVDSDAFQSVIVPLCKNLWLIGLVFNIYY